MLHAFRGRGLDFEGAAKIQGGVRFKWPMTNKLVISLGKICPKILLG